MDEHHDISLRISRLTTVSYSTSFSMGVKLLAKPFRMPIYAIYGFVRVADEIVDTFHGHDQQGMLEDFRKETFRAIEEKVSTNPILQSFQWVVNTYHIDKELTDSFFTSMEMDLVKNNHDHESYSQYIYGSAEVVGLMCL